MPRNTFKITGKEFNGRVKFVLLGLFAGIFFNEIKDWLNSYNINPMIVGSLGFLAILYFFNFEK